MNAGDFLAIGETDERYELVHGVVCMSPPPSTRHQAAASLIHIQLGAFAAAHRGVRFFAEVGLELSSSSVLTPDLVCYEPGRVRGFPQRLTVAPDLVIEVLSPRTKVFDLTTKRADYERFGVREYWTVDPGEGRIRCFRRVEGKLEETPVTGDEVASAALAGFVLDLRPLLALAREE